MNYMNWVITQFSVVKLTRSAVNYVKWVAQIVEQTDLQAKLFRRLRVLVVNKKVYAASVL